MTTWTVMQIILDLFFVAGGLLFWARLSRPVKDDPRMSKGLQLLQSKIAILEDLSDRTETQVKQLTLLLEQKGREVQDSVQAAQEQIHRVEMSIQKSMDVSKIFQDKIPHKEIIERQNTVKYIQAARLAHQGQSAEQIAAQIDIPKSELDFIVKVNRNKLMFSEEHLPEWAQESLAIKPEPQAAPSQYRDLSHVFESFNVAQKSQDDIQKIQTEFKQAVEDSLARTPATKTEVPNHPITEETSENISISESTHYLSQMATQIKNSMKEKIQNLGEEYFSTNLIEPASAFAKATADEPADVQPQMIATTPAVPEKAKVEVIMQGNKEMRIRPFVFKKFDDETDPEEFMKI